MFSPPPSPPSLSGLLQQGRVVQSWVKITQGWMLLKITEKIIRENAFEQQEKGTRVKMNHGLSANRPSNNWA